MIKSNLMYLLNIFIILLVSSCNSEGVASNLIFQSNRSIYWGDIGIAVPDGFDFAFDEFTGNGWFHTVHDGVSEFKKINSDGRVSPSMFITYNDGIPVKGGPGLFVANNIALVQEASQDERHMFVVDLSAKKSALVNCSKLEDLLICGFYNNKLIVSSYEKDYPVFIYDLSKGSFIDIPKGLINWGYMPVSDSLVGRNRDGKVAIFNLGENTMVSLPITVMKGADAGFVRSKYYLSKKYLYYARPNVAYIIINLPAYLIGYFSSVSKISIPRFWYRYNLINGTIEKIENDNKFITILGVLE